MKSPFLIIAAAGFCALAAPVSAATQFGLPGAIAFAAQSYTAVVSMLEDTGYRVTKITRTFLGRIKISAQNSENLRTVVVSRSTGEILSDRIIAISDGTGDSVGNATAAAGSGTTGGIASGSGGTSVSVGSGGASVSVGDTSVSVGLGG